jgi:hypothetical protein
MFEEIIVDNKYRCAVLCWAWLSLNRKSSLLLAVFGTYMVAAFEYRNSGEIAQFKIITGEQLKWLVPA